MVTAALSMDGVVPPPVIAAPDATSLSEHALEQLPIQKSYIHIRRRALDLKMIQYEA